MIFDVLVLLVAVAAIGLVARRADQRVAEAVARMEEKSVRREATIDKQAKVFVRRLEQSRRVGERAMDRAENAIKDAEQLNQIVQGFMRHRKIRRILEGGE